MNLSTSIQLPVAPVAGPVEPPHDRNLGAAARRKGVGKPLIRDQGQGAFRQRLLLVAGPAVGIAGEIGQRRIAASLGGGTRAWSVRGLTNARGGPAVCVLVNGGSRE